VEDGTAKGGFGSAVMEFMAEKGFSSRMKIVGIPDKFIEHGSLEELYALCGIDEEGIIRTVKEMVENK
jgi:1-deoxy-D-xylulose-5-phosphate synthase